MEFSQSIIEAIGSLGTVSINKLGELQISVTDLNYRQLMSLLYSNKKLSFEQLVDLTVIDYLTYKTNEWNTRTATSLSFSRAVTKESFDYGHKSNRFELIIHLLSVKQNKRLRVRCFVPTSLTVDTVCDLWESANWYEREAFDLFGVFFKGHHDLRRILTDYGFIGHPFRKDYPLIGEFEIRYDASQQSCLYEPVAIKNRTLVPKVIREQADDYRGQDQ